MERGADHLKLAAQTIAPSCSLSPDELATRLQELEDLGRGRLGLERTEGTLTVWFASDDTTERALQDVVAREQRCCPFLQLSVARTGERTSLRIVAPEGAERVLDAFARTLG